MMAVLAPISTLASRCPGRAMKSEGYIESVLKLAIRSFHRKCLAIARKEEASLCPV